MGGGQHFSKMSEIQKYLNQNISIKTKLCPENLEKAEVLLKKSAREVFCLGSILYKL